jgi:hypothetical protein
LEVYTLSELTKALRAVDGDGSETKEKNRDDDDDVDAGRGGKRSRGKAGVIRELGGGEDRTWAV